MTSTERGEDYRTRLGVLNLFLAPDGKGSPTVLHKRSGVKFPFFGVTVRECLTYTHYMEERLHSDYRYDRKFRGNITDGDRAWRDEHTLFVPYKCALPAAGGMLEHDLPRRGLPPQRASAASSIACIDEADNHQAIAVPLRDHPYHANQYS